MPIDYKPFIHPEDRDALEKLQAIPLLDTITKQYMKTFTEDMYHGINMATKIRLSPTQLPEVYRILVDVCNALQIDIPEFYLEMNPLPNAYTSGDTKPFVVVNSGIIDLLKPDELKAVIAHECGHILCHHVLYHTLADVLVGAGSGLGSIFGLGIVSEPLKWALMYWVRRSEFSADRVAAHVMHGSDTVVRTMLRLSGGSSKITANVNVDEFLRQAEEYSKFMKNSSKSSAIQNWMAKDLTHPYSAVRAAEVKKWADGQNLLRVSPSRLPFGNIKLKW